MQTVLFEPYGETRRSPGPCRYVKLPLHVSPSATIGDLVQEKATVDDRGQVLSEDGSLILPSDMFARSCRVVAVSDTHSLHSHMRQLPKGDLLVHCGDFTNTGSSEEYCDFDRWLSRQAAHGFEDRIFCVVGNHDAPRRIDQNSFLIPHAQVLKSQQAKRRLCPAGLRIFGQSWPESVPQGGLPEPRVDILLTHAPPAGILDTNEDNAHCGSTAVKSLVEKCFPRLHLFGHIHEAYGACLQQYKKGETTLLLNISNATRPLGMPPIVPKYIQYPVTVIDIELPAFTEIQERSLRETKKKSGRGTKKKVYEASDSPEPAVARKLALYLHYLFAVLASVGCAIRIVLYCTDSTVDPNK